MKFPLLSHMTHVCGTSFWIKSFTMSSMGVNRVVKLRHRWLNAKATVCRCSNFLSLRTRVAAAAMALWPMQRSSRHGFVCEAATRQMLPWTPEFRVAYDTSQPLLGFDCSQVSEKASSEPPEGSHLSQQQTLRQEIISNPWRL